MGVSSKGREGDLRVEQVCKAVLRRAACVASLCVTIAAPTARHAEAQEAVSTPLGRIAAQVGAGYFPSYVAEDSQTRKWGMDFSVRFGPATGAGLEVGYAYVPQASTTSSSAPRLHAFRVMVLGSMHAGPDSPVILTGGLGVAALVVRAQWIDCGDYVLCSEWAPRSGTWMALGGELGTVVKIWSRLNGLLEVHLFRAPGEAWSAAGTPHWISETSAGVSVRLGGHGGSG